MSDLNELEKRVLACKICTERFAATQTAHAPRPVFWLSEQAPILVAGQAPGARVQASGVPFDDRSGDRLRDWMGISRAEFYDRARVSVLPMAFCFPGYDAKGADLPPPPICARTWHGAVLAALPKPALTLLVGGYAQQYFCGKGAVTARVQGWRDHAPDVFPLPHPSWRNTGWIKKNPWFEAELVPALQDRIKEVIAL